MTGFTTRISSLRVGEMEQFHRDLAEAGFGGHHIRDLMADKAVFRDWVQDGIDRLEKLWACHTSLIPHKGWTQVGDTRIWIRIGDNPHVMGDVEMFAVEIGTDLPDSVKGRVHGTAHLRHTKWKEVVGGTQMRRWGSNGVEIRVPASAEREQSSEISQPASDEWGRERSIELRTGMLATLGLGDSIEANVWGPSQPHDCAICSSADIVVVRLTSWHRNGYGEIALHLRELGWIGIGDNTQVRPDPTARNTIWVRNRKH